MGAGFQYHAYEPTHAWASPVRAALRGLKLAFDMPFNPMGKTLWGRQSSVACDMFEELTRWYGKPEFGIKDVQIEDKTVPVTENVVLSKGFGGLLHFTRNAPTLRTAASGPLWRLERAALAQRNSTTNSEYDPRRIEGRVMGITEELCDKIVATTYDDLTEDAKDRARRLVIDGVAVAIAGTVQEEAPGILAKHIQALGGEAQSTAIGFGFKTSPVHAAYLNGASMHVLDYEPMWTPANHQVSTSLPALLALSERDGASGKDILTGIVKGTEMMGWIRQASGLVGRSGAKFHPPGLAGPLGSAVASSHILGLNTLTLRHALGIVASRAGSIFANVGTHSKSINCGHAVAMGVDAALLAGHGFNANPNVFEATNGYAETFFDSDFVLDELLNYGPPYRVASPGYAIKMFPSQFGTHFVITAALALHKKIDGKSEDIEKIKITTPKMDYVNRPHPETGLDGKFSWQYTTCCALLDGTVRMASFEDERRFAADMESMLNRVEHAVDVNVVPAFEEMHVTVEITLKDGTVHSETCDGPKGKYGRPPIPEDEHLVKVRDCLALKFDDKDMEHVIGLARRIDDLDATQVRELMGLLAC